MQSSPSITITDNRICSFYNDNPQFDIVAVNRFFIDFLEQFHSKDTNSAQKELLGTVQQLQAQMSNMKDSLTLKFHEIGKDCTGNISDIVQGKISGMLSSNSEAVVNKFQVLIPQNFGDLRKTIQDGQSQLIQDLQTMIETSSDKTALKTYTDNLDAKLSSVQQPLFSYINANYDKLTTEVDKLKESLTTQTVQFGGLCQELNQFLARYRVGSVKGSSSEVILGTLLRKMFPTAIEVRDTTKSQTSSGDFVLLRTGKPDILFENKDYSHTTNVPKGEVAKFLNDVTTQNCCGVMMSQHSGITDKDDFLVDIKNDKILVYLHNVDYSEAKIMSAVNLIDSLYIMLGYNKMGSEDENDDADDPVPSITVTMEFVESLNRTIQTVTRQKYTIIDLAKSHLKIITEQVNAIDVDAIQTWVNNTVPQLNGTASIAEKNIDLLPCPFASICNCTAGPFKGPGSLGSHLKLHARQGYDISPYLLKNKNKPSK